MSRIMMLDFSVAMDTVVRSVCVSLAGRVLKFPKLRANLHWILSAHGTSVAQRHTPDQSALAW